MMKMVKSSGGKGEGAEQEKECQVLLRATEIKDHRFVRARLCVDA